MTNISLIDGDTLLYLSTHNKKDEELKNISDIFKCLDLYIIDILKKTNSEVYAGFLTDSSFRYALAVQKPYKGNREGIPKPKYFNLAKAYLLDEYEFKTLKNYEADDLCIMSYNTFKNNKEYNPIIATPDKDLKQIAGQFYDYKKAETVEINEEDALKNLWKQVLTGDAGDNIPGLKNIGEVKANKILENIKISYHSTVLEEYIKTYGEYNGIISFTENYQLVKMVNTYNDELYYPHIVEKKDNIDEWLV